MADWWLGDLDDPWFKALERAVQDEWGTEPLRIREGGVCGLILGCACDD
jgi:di- and tripeptidase